MTTGVGASTWKLNCPEDADPLSTSTDQAWAEEVKVGLMTIRVLVCELMDRLVKTSPVFLALRVTVELDVKPVPLIVKGWELFEPVTGFGLTEEIAGAETGATT